MNIVHKKQYLGTPFSVECSVVENGPGVWNSTKVSIFRDNSLIGEYIRNYHSYGTETFYPFKAGDDWYALYSASYTSTRVMKLHEDKIEDWCGEDPSSGGFCPVEFYVPQYLIVTLSYNSGEVLKEFEYTIVDCGPKDEKFIEELNSPTANHNYCNFGFLSGCVWGDDSSWKLRYIDFSKIEDKVLSITDKFGYWELPSGLKLKECVDMSCWEPNNNWLTLLKQENINLKTNERC
jgi:hypothetical protein